MPLLLPPWLLILQGCTAAAYLSQLAPADSAPSFWLLLHAVRCLRLLLLPLLLLTAASPAGKQSVSMNEVSDRRPADYRYMAVRPCQGSAAYPDVPYECSTGVTTLVKSLCFFDKQQ
jgi:hypothetical protein